MDEIVASRNGYEVRSSVSGEYRLIRIQGEYHHEIPDLLREKVFGENANFAVDVSGLRNIGTPLARELFHNANLLRRAELKLVLVRPPERLRSLLEMIAPNDPLPTVSQVGEAEAPTGSAARELEKIAREIRSNRLWQFADREGCWICPYCAALQEDVVLPPDGSPPAATLEKVYRHLWTKCPAFSVTKPVSRTQAELEAARKRVNEEKVVVTKRKMSQLESRARRADELELSVKAASERQRRMLPAKAPDVPGLDIGILYRPAEHVSGDFFDFVTLSDGRLGMVMGDVSGHGIEAGILMGTAKKILSVRLEELGDPMAAVARANRDLFRDLDRRTFVTAILVVYDGKTLSICRAGHNPPLLLSAGAVRKLEKGGLGLGMCSGGMFDRTLELETTAVGPGDLLLLYTDGLVEARNAEGEEFGLERAVGLLQSGAGSPSAFLLSDLSSAVERFGPQEDDVTAVCVRFVG